MTVTHDRHVACLAVCCDLARLQHAAVAVKLSVTARDLRNLRESWMKLGEQWTQGDTAVHQISIPLE